MFQNTCFILLKILVIGNNPILSVKNLGQFVPYFQIPFLNN